MANKAFLLFLPLLLIAPTPQQAPGLSTEIDDGVRKIAGFGLFPASARCDDGAFLRRVMLDLVGHPPGAAEVRRFSADPTPDKRAAKIDELLAGDRFADFWARRWMAVFFGNYHEFRLDPLKSVDRADAERIMESFRRWLQERLKRDASWADIVRDLLEAEGAPATNPAVAYKLGTMNWARLPRFENRVVQQFLGIDMSCTGCHDHPFDKWKVEDGYALMAFSTGRRLNGLEIKEEAESVDHVVRIPNFRFEKPNPPVPPKFFLGRGVPGPNEVLAKAFARFVTAPQNEQFSNAAANRIWSWLLGRGLVHPVDEFSMKNKALSFGLLRSVGEEFRKSGYSTKSLVRAICLSETYQRRADGPGLYDRVTFARGQIRPLSAEQILNSLETATRGTPTFDVLQAQSLAELLIRGDRAVCEVTELPADPRALLWMSNGERVWSLIRDGDVVTRLRALKKGRVTEMFLAALSREPSSTESQRFEDFLKQGSVDEAYWALLNSTEFLTRH